MSATLPNLATWCERGEGLQRTDLAAGGILAVCSIVKPIPNSLYPILANPEFR